MILIIVIFVAAITRSKTTPLMRRIQLLQISTIVMAIRKLMIVIIGIIPMTRITIAIITISQIRRLIRLRILLRLTMNKPIEVVGTIA